MATLGQVGQIVMDGFYQDFKPGEAFFNIDDFIFQVVAAYNKVLNDDYNANKLLNKQIFGFSVVDISSDILKEARVKVTKDEFSGDYIAVLPEKIWQPAFDMLGTGVQEVQIKGCADAIRIGRTDVWKLTVIPPVPENFYIAEEAQVRFKKPNGIKEGTEVKILYVPRLSSDNPDGVIADSKVFQVQTIALQFMLSAKDGSVIDMTLNQNPNKAAQSEMDI